MKITSVNRTPHFGAQGQDVNFDASKEKKKKYYSTHLDFSLDIEKVHD